MVNNIINVSLVFTILIFFFKKSKNWIKIYTVCMLIAPVFNIGGMRVAFDIAVFPIILVLFLVAYKGRFQVHRNLINIFLYVGAYFFLTLLASLRFECGFSIVTLYAGLRFTLTIQILHKELQNAMERHFSDIFGVAIFGHLIACVIQMMQILPVSFFYNLYYKESLTPLRGQLRIGYFDRAYGLTGSPLIMGGMAVLFFCFFLNISLKYGMKKQKNGMKLIMSILCGIFALSKTAIIGIPLVALLTIFFNRKQTKITSNNLIKISLYVCSAILILSIVIDWLRDSGFTINYYLRFLTNPFAALETRYDSDSGNLVPAISMIKEHFLFGVGNYKGGEIFLGDSSYIVILYNTGIIGLLLYFIPYMTALFSAIRQKDVLHVSMVVSIALILVGNSLHWTGLLAPFAFVALYENKFKGEIGEC